MQGERLIVCRHGRPVATLQPLNGSVLQPFEGREYDIYGVPLGDARSELAKLTDIQRALLADGIIRLHFVTGGLGIGDLSEAGEALRDFGARGLARRVPGRGWIPTARGLVLREALFEQMGRPPEVFLTLRSS